MSELSWVQGDLRWLAAGAVPLLALIFFVDHKLRQRRLRRLGDPRLIAEMAATTSGARRGVKALLFTLAIGLGALALAGPQQPDRRAPPEARGIDLALALDFSKSMLAADIKPTRLQAAKDELGELLDTLPGDRIALVAFAGEAIRYPLTTDHAAVKLFWSELGPADMPVGGTALGLAIKSGIRSLVAGREPGKERDQAMVLVTDGEDTEGGDPIAAAREAAALGIRIFTVGIGGQGGARVPEVDELGHPTGIKRNPDGSEVTSALDDKTLIQIAAETGGEYYPMGRGLGGLAARLSQLKKAVTKKQAAFKVDEYKPLFMWLLLPAFILLLLESVLRERRRVRAPRVRAGGVK
ncbi:MAG: VWA domain-containing protein [Deltaproteobacteria bacterium]|nr:VWA domain-containing protein [Deltaproteobacteria bacterium]